MEIKVCLLGFTIFHIFYISGVTQGSFCPSPPKPEEGDVHPKNDIYSAGDKLTYRCYGNTLQSNLTNSTCLSNGTWDYHPPYCDKAIDIAEGNLIGDGYTSVNHLAVDSNYTSCLSSKTPWSIYDIILQRETIVRAVRITANSDLNSYRIYLKDENYKTFSCNTNFLETGNQKVIFCQEPKLVNKIMIMKHGKKSANCELCEVDVFGSIDSCSTKSLFVRNGTVTYNRSSAHLQCKEGFQPIEYSSSSCQSNGLWSNDFDCKPIPCRSPPDVPEGKWINPITNTGNETEFAVDTELDLVCNSEFELEGSRATITCILGGFWSSPKNPPCKGISDSSNSDYTQSENTYIAAGTVVAVIFVITIFVSILFTVWRRRKKEQRSAKEGASYFGPSNGSSNCGEEYTYASYKEDDAMPSSQNPDTKNVRGNHTTKSVKFLLPPSDGSTNGDAYPDAEKDFLQLSENGSQHQMNTNTITVTPCNQYDNQSFSE